MGKSNSLPKSRIQMAKNVVRLNSTVTLKNGSSTIQITLVEPASIDLSANKISILSPMGKCLLNRAEYETFTLITPAGEKAFKILAILN